MVYLVIRIRCLTVAYLSCIIKQPLLEFGWLREEHSVAEKDALFNKSPSDMTIMRLPVF